MRSSQPRRLSGGSCEDLLSSSGIAVAWVPARGDGPSLAERSGWKSWLPARISSVQVGVVEAQPGQDFTLQHLHRLGLALVLVVAAQQVQHPVHGQVGIVGGRQLALFTRLAG